MISYEELKENMRKTGTMAPIIITRDGKVIDGHTRLRIARELHWKRVDVVRLDVEMETIPVEELTDTYDTSILLQGKKRSKV